MEHWKAGPMEGVYATRALSLGKNKYHCCRRGSLWKGRAQPLLLCLLLYNGMMQQEGPCQVQIPEPLVNKIIFFINYPDCS